MKAQVYLGYDPREIAAYLVAVNSLMRHSPSLGPPVALELDLLRNSGLYTRPTEFREGRLYDVISEHPMSTEFAVSRFLVPFFAFHDLGDLDWALFADCDVLFRRDVHAALEKYADPKYAVMCVKHNYQPTSTQKMIGQVQSRYNRKNWSSVCLWNPKHPANRKLTISLINSVPGRDLHAFCWLEDEEIGELPPEFNYLVNATDSSVDPTIVHFTEGTPHMPGHECDQFADEWFDELRRITPVFLRAFGSLPL